MTCMILLRRRPLENTATEVQPLGFGFYYMTYKYDSAKLRCALNALYFHFTLRFCYISYRY